MLNKKMSEVQKMKERKVLYEILHILRQDQLISVEEEIEAKKILNRQKE